MFALFVNMFFLWTAKMKLLYPGSLNATSVSLHFTLIPFKLYNLIDWKVYRHPYLLSSQAHKSATHTNRPGRVKNR